MTLDRERNALVLLVEDNPAEQNLAKRSLQKGCVRCDLDIVSDGEQALDYMYRRGEYAHLKGKPFPDVILLDLNLPRIDGREVLETLKTHPQLKSIPIVILTTSKKEEDIVRSYELGCNSFLNKPVDMDDFIHILREFGSYWFRLVVLPPQPDGELND